MIKKVLLLGVVTISLASIATACVATTTDGGTGTGGAGTGGTGGVSAGGTGGVSTGGVSAGGTGGVSTGGVSAGGTGGSSFQPPPTGCITASIQVHCNPITNDGCNTSAGEACDLGQTKGQTTLGCFPAPNTQKAGDSCNGSKGPFCEGTLHCDSPLPPDGDTTDAGGTADGGTTPATCKHYCCANSDCNGGTCTAFDSQLGTLGVCN